MFKLNPTPTFKFRVKVYRPGEDLPTTLTLVGRHQKQSQLKTWLEKGRAAEGKDAEFLLDVVCGWEDVAGEDDKPVTFNAEAFSALLDAYPGVGLQIVEAYIGELSAGRAKN